MNTISRPEGPHRELTVGQVAARSGVAISTIHFYESKGLIRSWRNKSNHRRYARAVLRHYRAFMATAPEELTAYAGLLSTPDGVPVVGMIICYCGTLAEGERVLAPLRQFGTPVPRRASGIRTLHFHIAPRCTT